MHTILWAEQLYLCCHRRAQKLLFSLSLSLKPRIPIPHGRWLEICSVKDVLQLSLVSPKFCKIMLQNIRVPTTSELISLLYRHKQIMKFRKVLAV
jgi:hypothetical protein